MTVAIALRPIEEADTTFLQRVYASTRADILALPWDEASKSSFLEMQFRAQHTYYRAQYPAADYLIVEKDGQPVGRLYVDRRPDCIHILDIALIPEVRGSRIGSKLLDDLLEEGRATRRDVSLYVERENTARRLYQRLSFEPAGEQGIYILMRWKCPPATTK